MNNRTLKTIALILSSLLFTLAGCKGKDDPKEKNKEKKEAKITFQLSLPQGEAYTFRATPPRIHDAEEWGIKVLTMYTFSADGSKLVAVDKVEASTLIPSGDAKYSYTKTFTPETTGIYRFLFVANEEVANVTANTNISQNDFEKKLLSKTLSEDGSSKDLLYKENGTPDKYYIPMTGIAEQNGDFLVAVTGSTVPVSVVLTRAVARIDIENHIPNLTITKLSLKNTWDKSFLFPDKDSEGRKNYNEPSDAMKVSMSKGYADIPSSFKGTAGEEGNRLKKAFYIYEGPQDPSNSAGSEIPFEKERREKYLRLIVEGKLENGQEVVYELPFERTSTTYSPIDIKRNFLYRVIIGDNNPAEKGSKLTFTIEDSPWNTILLNHELQIISVTMREVESEKQHYDRNNRIFYTNSGGRYNFDIKTILKGHTKFEITHIPNADSEEELEVKWDDLRNEHYVYMPSVYAPNKKNKCVATFEICSDSNPNIVRTLTIIAEKDYKNPKWK